MIKSPLRYPGGKSRALDVIGERLPASFREYREPMVGGGSVFLYVRHHFPQVPCWINDANYDLVCFWKAAKEENRRLVNELRMVRANTTDGKELFERLRGRDKSMLTDFERAVRLFVLNRITFSGTIEAGGFSQNAFEQRFTTSAIERVRSLESVLCGVWITHGDYAPLLSESGNDVFVFLDPPYITATESKLYGENGVLHTGFDHQRFALSVQRSAHRCLVTYDDAPELERRFSGATLHRWSLQYGMNNYRQSTAARGAELMISNYQVQPLDLFGGTL